VHLIVFLFSLLSVGAAQAQQPKRIVSTAPSFTETLFAVGAGDRVIAVSTYCHYPPQVDELPRVGTYLNPNIESIARLRPDIVLVHSEQSDAIEQLSKVGIQSVGLKNTTLEDTLATMVQIGAAVGNKEQGLALERGLRAKLRDIERRASGKPRRSLLFVVGRTPGRLDGLIAVGKGSFLNELIRIAGGRNVLSDSPVAYPRISLESVMRLDPDVIVDMGDMAVTSGVTEKHKQSVVKLWESQPAIRAVKEKHVFAVAADIFVVPGPRVTEAAEEFSRMLFGSSSSR
jgi:iron complex transport system substrate-binding protein